MTDPIADMLTRIRNATVPRRKRVDVPASRLKAEVARILQCEGYIHSYKMVDVVVEKWQVPRSMIRIQLKYGSRGVMTGRDAVKVGVGGEVLCNVW